MAADAVDLSVKTGLGERGRDVMVRVLYMRDKAGAQLDKVTQTLQSPEILISEIGVITHLARHIGR